MIWIIAFVLALLIEVFTYAFISIWFCVGSIFAFIAMKFGASFLTQILIFFIVSGLSIWLLKPLRDRFLKKNIVKTNIDALIGEIAVVTEDINNLDARGAVRLKGLIYSAISENGEVIKSGNQVVVKKIEGVKLIVQPLSDEQNANRKGEED